MGFPIGLDCYDGQAKTQIIDEYPHYCHVICSSQGVQVKLSVSLQDNIKDITHCAASELTDWLYNREQQPT